MEIEVGDIYDWVDFPQFSIEVEQLGSWNAYVLVTDSNGATWHKWIPLPFAESFVKRNK